MWTCPKCGAEVDASFDACWRCGTSPEGVEDPNFVTADQAGPIEGEPLVPELNVEGIEDRDAIAGIPADDLIECYQAATIIEARFLADGLIGAGIPAVSDTHDLQEDALAGWQGNPSVYCRREDLPRARAWLASYEARPKGDDEAGGETQD